MKRAVEILIRQDGMVFSFKMPNTWISLPPSPPLTIAALMAS